MKDNKPFDIIATIKTDFKCKFGIPRQSGLVEKTKAKIVFEKEYRDISALRGLEEFSHLWLIWKFSESQTDEFKPTVRPPKLGGNKRVGVFATRSPFRPNPIGLSSVKIEEVILEGRDAPYIIVSGADLLDNTPIYDIKPYIPYTDCHKDAKGSFADEQYGKILRVEFSNEAENIISKEEKELITAVLERDPRPGYQNDGRVYSFEYASFSISFKVENEIVYVLKIEKI